MRTMTSGPWDPEQLAATGESSLRTLSPGEVELTVADLDRSLRFHESVLGLEVVQRHGARAVLGADGRPLLLLVEEPGARPPGRATGLYHFALLVPERVDLARWLAHALRDRVALTGASDHFVSEALYLDDPDGPGIEVYWDRPREVWEGQVADRLTTLPLDARGLLSELREAVEDRFERLPPGTTMGHVHLKVAAIPETVAFYRDGLGLPVTARLGVNAAFFAAGGYHHHIGANTWESRGAPQPPAGSAALRQVTLALVDEGERRRVLDRIGERGARVDPNGAEDGPVVVDPSGIRLVLAVR
jgi:catechol 2,3-dioxygenase